jgi:hypothetical protein
MRIDFHQALAATFLQSRILLTQTRELEIMVTLGFALLREE